MAGLSKEPELFATIARVAEIDKAAERVLGDPSASTSASLDQLEAELEWLHEKGEEEGWEFAPVIDRVRGVLARAGRRVLTVATLGALAVGAVSTISMDPATLVRFVVRSGGLLARAVPVPVVRPHEPVAVTPVVPSPDADRAAVALGAPEFSAPAVREEPAAAPAAVEPLTVPPTTLPPAATPAPAAAAATPVETDDPAAPPEKPAEPDTDTAPAPATPPQESGPQGGAQAAKGACPEKFEGGSECAGRQPADASPPPTTTQPPAETPPADETPAEEDPADPADHAEPAAEPAPPLAA